MPSELSKLLLVDESDEIARGGTRYVVACVAAESTAAAALADRLATSVRTAAGRSRPFHWADEGPTQRVDLLSFIAQQKLDVFAAIGTVGAGVSQEQVRYECLRKLFIACAEDATELVIESRESALRNVGQNRTDHRAIIDSRHARQLPVRMHYRWAAKSEPLLWMPDTIAGSVLAAIRGDGSWLRHFQNEGGRVTTVDSRPSAHEPRL